MMEIGSWAPRMGEEKVAKMMCLAVCWVGVLRAAGVRKTGKWESCRKGARKQSRANRGVWQTDSFFPVPAKHQNPITVLIASAH